MTTVPRLIGVVHLGALPDSPRFAGDLDRVVGAAVADARALQEAGFGAVIVENFGDAPFYADNVPNATVAAMTLAVARVADAVDVPFGVNVLRNDVLAALAIAAATGAAFVRVNVLTGTMLTDQGTIEGRAAEALRLRASLHSSAAIYADVMVKHAVAPPGTTIEQVTADTTRRGGADAVIVSGAATGDAPDRDTIRRAASAAGPVPVLIGSGATENTVGGLLEVADGVIVGTCLKVDGVTTNPVDGSRAAAFVKAAG